MTEPAFDPRPGSPYEASSMSRERRAEGHNLPPGPSRRFDRRHWLWMDQLGWMIMLTMAAVAIYFFGWDAGWWGAG